MSTSYQQKAVCARTQQKGEVHGIAQAACRCRQLAQVRRSAATRHSCATVTARDQFLCQSRLSHLRRQQWMAAIPLSAAENSSMKRGSPSRGRLAAFTGSTRANAREHGSVSGSNHGKYFSTASRIASSRALRLRTEPGSVACLGCLNPWCTLSRPATVAGSMASDCLQPVASSQLSRHARHSHAGAESAALQNAAMIEEALAPAPRNRSGCADLLHATLLQRPQRSHQVAAVDRRNKRGGSGSSVRVSYQLSRWPR